MNTDLIVISIGILAAIFNFQKTRSIPKRGILIGLVVSYLLHLLSGQIFQNISFYIFGLLVILFTVQSLINKIWISSVISAFASISVLFGILHYPGAYELRLSMIIPVSIFIISIIRKNYLSEDFPILWILASYELAKFLGFFIN